MNVGTGKGSRIGTPSKAQIGHWADISPRPPSTDALFAEELVEQYLALGMSRTEALRLLQLGYAALNDALEKIDIHAFAVVPLADQVSMLLPRLDIDNLSQLTGLATAEVQSALAMLTLEYVMLLRLT